MESNFDKSIARMMQQSLNYTYIPSTDCSISVSTFSLTGISFNLLDIITSDNTACI